MAGRAARFQGHSHNMNIEQRIRHPIGDLVIQLQAATAKIEELQAKVNQLEKSEE